MSSNLQLNTCGAFTMRRDCHLCDSPTQLYVPQLRRASHRPMHLNTDGYEVKRSSSPVADSPSRQSWVETRKMAVTLGELEELYRANNKNRHGTWKAAAAQDETDTIKEECRWLTEQRDTLGKKVEELQNQLKEERKKNARSPSITFSLQTEADTTRMSGQQLLTALKEENMAIKKQKKPWRRH
ncbi:rhoptry protein [Trypanosoma cruzi]|nr:rhoptry protein [Trypanosoma cruzi]